MSTALDHLAARLAELDDGERLVVSMLPRHGMSRLASKRLREVLAEQGAKLLELSPPHGASDAVTRALTDAWLDRPLAPPIPEDLMQHATDLERALCPKPECKQATASPEQVKALEATIAKEEARIRAKMVSAGVGKPKQKGLARTPSPDAYARRRAQAKAVKRSKRRNR